MPTTIKDLRKRVIEEVNYKSCTYRAVHQSVQALIKHGDLAKASRMEQIKPFTGFEQDLIDLINQIEQSDESEKHQYRGFEIGRIYWILVDGEWLERFFVGFERNGYALWQDKENQYLATDPMEVKPRDAFNSWEEANPKLADV